MFIMVHPYGYGCYSVSAPPRPAPRPPPPPRSHLARPSPAPPTAHNHPHPPRPRRLPTHLARAASPPTSPVPPRECACWRCARRAIGAPATGATPPAARRLRRLLRDRHHHRLRPLPHYGLSAAITSWPATMIVGQADVFSRREGRTRTPNAVLFTFTTTSRRLLPGRVRADEILRLHSRDLLMIFIGCNRKEPLPAGRGAVPAVAARQPRHAQPRRRQRLRRRRLVLPARPPARATASRWAATRRPTWCSRPADADVHDHDSARRDARPADAGQHARGHADDHRAARVPGPASSCRSRSPRRRRRMAAIRPRRPSPPGPPSAAEEPGERKDV